MTETEWLKCVDPYAMIEFLREERTHFRTRWLGWVGLPKFKVSERKWRLFYCAVLQRIAHLLPAEEPRQLIRVAELYADGLLSDETLQATVQASVSVCEGDQLGRSWSTHQAVLAISRFHRPENEDRSSTLLHAARAWATTINVFVSADPDWQAEVAAERVRQAELLREVLGNPFRLTVADAAWLAWNNGTVRRMTQAIYEDKRWEELPILADALEDAGCGDEALLAHCRGPGPHVRGCWALDTLLSPFAG